MNKPMLGLLLGAVLGAIDGLTAPLGLHDPEVSAGLMGIVIGSTMKGLVAGLLIGLVARWTNSMPITLIFGVIISGLFAFLVAHMQGKYYLRITLPGAILGGLVGFAVQAYGFGPRAIREHRAVGN